MPFKSAKQRKFLYAKKPKVAAKFAAHSKRREGQPAFPKLPKSY